MLKIPTSFSSFFQPVAPTKVSLLRHVWRNDLHAFVLPDLPWLLVHTNPQPISSRQAGLGRSSQLHACALWDGCRLFTSSLAQKSCLIVGGIWFCLCGTVLNRWNDMPHDSLKSEFLHHIMLPENSSSSHDYLYKSWWSFLEPRKNPLCC